MPLDEIGNVPNELSKATTSAVCDPFNRLTKNITRIQYNRSPQGFLAPKTRPELMNLETEARKTEEDRSSTSLGLMLSASSNSHINFSVKLVTEYLR